MIVTDGIPAAVYEYKRAKIDEDRHIDIYPFDEELSAILRMIKNAPSYMKPQLVQAAIAHIQRRNKEPPPKTEGE